jgi:hypothetical protein
LAGRRLLSSKVIQLKGYALAKFYGKPTTGCGHAVAEPAGERVCLS